MSRNPYRPGDNLILLKFTSVAIGRFHTRGGLSVSGGLSVG